MADNAGPSNSQTQVLSQFQEFCDVSTIVARDFLEKSDWNLENAIHQYFQVTEGNSFNDITHWENNTKVSTNLTNNEHQIRQSISPPLAARGGLYGWIGFLRHYLITVPLKLFYTALTQALTFVYVLLANQRFPVTDPRGDVRLFLEEIIEKQEGCDRVSFVNGSYDDALRRAKRNVQCLIVYLHSPSVLSDNFLKTHILTDRFCAFLQHNDALLWGVSTSSEEGRRVSTALRLLTYPSLALITCVHGGNMACILRLSDNEMRSVDGVLNALQNAFDENQPHIRPLVREKAERERNSMLIREQEEEYARSLAADKAKRDERLRLETEQKDRERQKQEEADRINKKKKKIAEIREKIREKLSSEPILLNKSASASNVIVCVRMKFPNGQTHTHNFNVEASLEELFNVVLVHECCPDDFSLVMGYPPQTLNCAPEWYREYSSCVPDTSKQITTLGEAGFQKSAVVMVRDNDA